MNNNNYLNELTSILSEMLSRENDLFNEMIVPITDEQKKTFAAGYAEGIADILRILTEIKFFA